MRTWLIHSSVPNQQLILFPASYIMTLGVVRCLSRGSCVTTVFFLSFSNRLRPIFVFPPSYRHQPFFSYLDFPTLTHTLSLSRSLSFFFTNALTTKTLHALCVKPEHEKRHTPPSSVSHSVAVLHFFMTPTHPTHF